MEVQVLNLNRLGDVTPGRRGRALLVVSGVEIVFLRLMGLEFPWRGQN
ncbi:MAG TPA: hypothetical protein PKM72_10600 [Nitrospirales bacterium]|nr:hypothetical protein [Nitrospirales bacterium]